MVPSSTVDNIVLIVVAFLLENAFNGSQFVNESSEHPLIRMFTSYKQNSAQPVIEQSKIEESWSVSSPKAVSMNVKNPGAGANDDNWLYMSAVCYLFAIHLQPKIGDVPIGLVNTNWGVRT